MLKRISLALTLLLFLAAFNRAMAADTEVPLGNEGKPSPSKATGAKAPADTGEVDISDVQGEYWKARDKQFEVIQNRLYTKTHRVELAPMFGIYQRVDYQSTKTLGAALAYHFNDMWGLELMGYKMFNADSAMLSKFQDQKNATIEFNKEKYFLGLSVLFTPIYAKFSFLNHKISHFDMYVAAGGGVTSTVSLRPTANLGVGQKFWITPKWNLRLEYRWLMYSDRTVTTEGKTATKNGGPGYFDETVNNYNLIFGISYLFN